MTDYKYQRLSPIPISVNNPATLELPRGKWWTRLYLFLKGTVNVTTEATGLTEDAPMSLLKRIEIISSAPKLLSNLKDFSGANKYHKQQLQTGFAGKKVAPPITVANSPFSCLITIPFITQTSVNPLATFLESRLFDAITLKILFGAKADLLTGGVVEEPIGFVYPVLELLEPGAEIVPNDILIERSFQKTITAADTKFIIPLSKGGDYKSIFYKAIRAGVRSDASVVDSRIVLNGLSPKFDLKWDEHEAINIDNYGVAAPTGVRLYEFDPDGDLNGLIISAALSELESIHEVNAPSGVTNLQIVSDELVKPT